MKDAETDSRQKPLSDDCPGCAKVRRKAAQGERYGCALHPEQPNASLEARALGAASAFVSASGRGAHGSAWLAVVRDVDASRPALTEEQIDVLARAMPDVVDYERATPEQRHETVLDVLAIHGPRPTVPVAGGQSDADASPSKVRIGSFVYGENFASIFDDRGMSVAGWGLSSGVYHWYSCVPFSAGAHGKCDSQEAAETAIREVLSKWTIPA